MYYTWFESPIGKILLAGDERGLTRIGFPKGKMKMGPETTWQINPQPFKAVTRQLQAYFDGKLTTFNLKLAPKGTEFQLSVWKALQEIPYGETMSYSELAKKIGRPKASRAVGAANGNNPLPIVMPCHRVIGINGSLTGFGGGLPTKQFLLELEKSVRLT
mgnify:CR=1 FL=1